MAMIIELIGNLICSIFLTYLVSTITLTTKLQVAFVFLYFVLMNFILYIIYKKYKKIIMEKKGLLLLTVLISILVSFFSLPDIYPKVYDSKIALVSTAEKNPSSNGNEIWISKISVDNAEVKLDNIELENNWVYNADSNSIFINGMEHKQAVLPLSLPGGNNVSITFNKHAWSGVVEVVNGDSITKEDLFSQDADKAICNIQRKIKEPVASVKVILWLGCLVTLCRSLLFLRSLYYRKKKK
jgi:hypothetical protein